MKSECRILVEVDSANVRPITFTDKKTGNPRTIYAQDLHVFLGGAKYPEKVEVVHSQATDAVPVGMHYAESLRLTRQGRVELDLKSLKPAPASDKK